MDQEKYEQLREVIIKANPEILKLEFGCEIVFEKEGYKGNLFHRLIVGDLGEWLRTNLESIKKNQIHNVIGRPIRLSDILLAAQKHRNASLGLNIAKSPDLKTYVILESWNLKNDNLDDQSDYCKDLLYSLLVGEE